MEVALGYLIELGVAANESLKRMEQLGELPYDNRGEEENIVAIAVIIGQPLRNNNTLKSPVALLIDFLETPFQFSRLVFEVR
ncbi:hypothetical protein INR49_000389 [Caranx melampygus]|nr:hypothetical protein INR49_000389 [Caranx melampygus]